MIFERNDCKTKAISDIKALLFVKQSDIKFNVQHRGAYR